MFAAAEHLELIESGLGHALFAVVAEEISLIEEYQMVGRHWWVGSSSRSYGARRRSGSTTASSTSSATAGRSSWPTPTRSSVPATGSTVSTTCWKPDRKIEHRRRGVVSVLVSFLCVQPCSPQCADRADHLAAAMYGRPRTSLCPTAKRVWGSTPSRVQISPPPPRQGETLLPRDCGRSVSS